MSGKLCFRQKKINKFSEDDLDSTIGLGIVQKWQEKHNFIHRTFAEYLVAEYIADERISAQDKIERRRECYKLFASSSTRKCIAEQ